MTKKINFLKVSSRLLFGTGLAIIAVLIMSTPLSAQAADAITRQLEVGMTGSDVSALQTFLAQDVTLYPQGLVTGYFGYLTKAAVSNFQVRNGIDSVGRIGPVTLPIINAQMANGMNFGTDISAPTISNVSVTTSSNNAIVYWNTSEYAKGVVYYSNVPLILHEQAYSATVSGSIASTDMSFRFSQSVNISGLQSNTTYYYLIYVTDQASNVTITLPGTFRTN